MVDLLRQAITAEARTVVIKVGTRSLSQPDGKLDEPRVASLADELRKLIDSGRKVALVSSGAVGAGMGLLDMSERPIDLAQLQAVAAIGQSYLVQAYERSLRSHGRHAAQILLTAEDLDDRTRYLNVRNTILTLMELGAVPIINENDTVSVAELQITFGDNDRLAAMVTNLLQAPLLVILSDVDGLYDRDPKLHGAEVIQTVTRLDDGILALACDRVTGRSKGGMSSKLAAARMATASGENVIIANGTRPGSLGRIFAGEPEGTLFLAEGAKVAARKRWIGFTAQPRGHLVLDDGACRAVLQQGKSLLAIGLKDAIGPFQKGDIVGLRDERGAEFARGLSNYSAADLRRIKGMRTDAIASVLGHCPYKAVVHRDNMTLTRPADTHARETT